MRYEALQKSDEGIKGHYIPSCDANGDFTAIQNHASTGKSWCVDPKTGDKYEDSLTDFNEKPDCSKYMRGTLNVATSIFNSCNHSILLVNCLF